MGYAADVLGYEWSRLHVGYAKSVLRSYCARLLMG